MRAKAERASAGKFLGVPTENFEGAGREQLIQLLRAGLTPSAKILDLGCGVLRGGYWLIHFLDAGCYCGIEPNEERLRIGTDHILEPEIIKCKQPRFDTNPHFDTSVFREKFDFFVAYSIWTHASKSQIATMLDAFLRDSKETGIFLTTYLPPNCRHGDYKGDHWVGTSHESEVPGCINHSYRWIKSECRNRDLRVRKFGQDEAHGQFWLAISRDSTPARVRDLGKVGRLRRYLAVRLWV
jgi:SAM-dependent methyltransferase